VDEAVFSFKTFKTNAWSSAYSNLTIDNSRIRLAAQALIAGISEDTGLEHYLINKRSIKAEEFKQYI
jgi:DNA/RNA-binding domain of Phe-tRNA-synthetase-like protein